MSSMSPHKLQCPKCGHEQETTIWESINVSISPELKESLLKGEVNTFTCEKCGDNAFIAAPLLYHDMDAKFCVQYFPAEALDDGNFYEQFSDRGYLAAGIGAPNIKGVAYLYRPHIVFDINEMVRYITFRDRLGTCAGFIHDPAEKDENSAFEEHSDKASGSGASKGGTSESPSEKNPQ